MTPAAIREAAEKLEAFFMVCYEWPARIEVMEAAIRSAVEQAEKPLREALRGVEWTQVVLGELECPACGNSKRDGHAVACSTARTLSSEP